MSVHRWSGAAAAAVFAVQLAAAGTAHAQAEGLNSFVAVTPIYRGDADLDGGGDFRVGGVILRAGVAGQLADGIRAGVSFNYDYQDFSFSNPVAFGSVAPWGIVQRYGVTAPFTFQLRDGWSVGVAPSLDWFRENNASSSDSLAWGATFTAINQFQDGNRLGLGIGVFDQIEDTSIVAFPIVDWRLGDRWRLVNPLASGPTGGAGIELDYQFDGGWTMGVGAAYRNYRFRLSESGPVPNGIGEERGVPVFLRATYSWNRQMSMHIYAGVVTGGRLSVEDPSGNELRQVDFDPAPLLAVSFLGRF